MTWQWYKASVPIASFVIPFSRELLESYPFPPPATVYGMILSYIGETDRLKYRGTRVVVGVLQLPEVSWILRKTRRFKHPDITSKENSKPDLVNVLTSLEFVAGICDSAIPGIPSLNDEVDRAIRFPELTIRFGGLSCGESHNLLNSLDRIETSRLSDYDEIWWLLKSGDGEWTVSEWVDHVGSQSSRWVSAQLQPGTWTDMRDLLDKGAFVIDPGA